MISLSLNRARALVLAAVVGATAPAGAQVVVHDPLATTASTLHFISVIANQATQLQHMVTQLQNESINLRTFTNVGQWTQVQQRLAQLRTVITTAKTTGAITGNVADAQIARMNSELATVNSLENLANTSTGNVQAQQAMARLQAEMIAQLHEQRDLTLAQLKQTQLENADALAKYHAKPQDPSTY
jgi:conjugal transfer/entry exclusion protein